VFTLWDIVDSSAHLIVGPHLQDKSRKTLYTFARSSSLWERRIAIMATFHYIRQNEFNTALDISELLVNDREDLIHKAVGWMLREIGKRDLKTEEQPSRNTSRACPAPCCATPLRNSRRKSAKPISTLDGDH